MLFILIALFYCSISSFFTNSTISDNFRSDYESKETLIQNGTKVKKGLIVQSKKFKEEYKELKNIFLKLEKVMNFLH